MDGRVAFEYCLTLYSLGRERTQQPSRAKFVLPEFFNRFVYYEIIVLTLSFLLFIVRNTEIEKT